MVVSASSEQRVPRTSASPTVRKYPAVTRRTEISGQVFASALAADHDERVGEAGIERVVAGDRSRLDARKRPRAPEKSGRERVHLLEIREHREVDRVAAPRELVLGLQRVLDAETGIDMPTAARNS